MTIIKCKTLENRLPVRDTTKKTSKMECTFAKHSKTEPSQPKNKGYSIQICSKSVKNEGFGERVASGGACSGLLPLDKNVGFSTGVCSRSVPSSLFSKLAIDPLPAFGLATTCIRPRKRGCQGLPFTSSVPPLSPKCSSMCVVRV